MAYRAHLPHGVIRHSFFSVVVRAAVLVAIAASPACRRSGESAHAVLDRFFASARSQDYAATYDCYDAAYRAKVSRDEFVRHRREASPLESWRVVSLDEHGDRARAVVALVFGPWPRAGRSLPASTTVEEELVREAGGWRIKVW